ncbi:hypothetical protein AALP_AA1G055700 [Arabis alpina]|uniref:RING-type domain-containing protein n=1 Tax=Arabis alpina TaxID=50452 RepID=A0A087HLB9_ARAAL|nr:hypothetical protein AALP_AA1G055700 [Arabis alpina]
MDNSMDINLDELHIGPEFDTPEEVDQTKTWRIKSVINESPASEWNLWLKCPYESCRVTGGRDMIQRFATDEEKSKYNRFLFISYVDDNKMMKCCPVPGRCTNNLSPDSESSKVLCQCLLTFCWNCCNDAHSPVDCETAAKWLAKIMSGYQNSNRLCRGDWTNHGEETCTNDAVMDIPYEETNSQWETEECYENWQSNDLLMQKAKVKLQQLRSVDIPKLSKIQLPTEQQLEFIKEAGLQVIESRRILKWTYAYQYYLPDDNKQNLLKICQGNVKLLLKALDKCIETKLPGFLNAEGVSEKFNAFRFKLTRLTRTTREYNEKLMRELEAGLANDVSASGMPQMAYNSDQTSGSGLNHDE